MSDIIIKGAKTHNLKNIDVNIPRDKLVVITGLSGSGKSSLAFDTLYAEGQRRYVESLSAYARQFLSMMEKPDVDLIEGLSPAISIEQKATSHNPRSTVGTITEIYDYLRLLYARVGTPFCPEHKTTKLSAQTVSQIVDSLCSLEQGTKINLLAPVVINQKGEFVELFKKYMANGYVRALVNGEKIELSDPPKLQKHYKHNISVIVDRVKIKEGIEQRLAESIEHIIEMSDGLIHVSIEGDEKESKTLVFSTKYACVECGFSAPTLEPRNFSFNNPIGACQSCNGLGVDQYFDPNKIITDHSLTIAQGAIRGWDSRKFFYFSMLKSLADHFNFDIDEPYQDLSEDTKNKILYGTGDEDIHFHYVNSQGSSYTRTNPFEGVVPNMQRRFRETDSNLVRDELSKCLSTRPCKSCDGDRLGPLARNVKIDNITLPEIANMSIAESYNIFNIIKLEGNEKEIADKISKEIKDRLSFLMNVGLNYLSLSRSAETLSGGESQRIRLASQIGSGLVGVMYILDEPSIGLHQRDNDKLLETLFRLRDLGNTVIVVEHDEDAIKQSDYLIDMGPKAGVHGGNIVASGTPSEVMNNPNSITGMYMSGKKQIEIPQKLNQYDKNQVLKISDATLNNLKNISAEIPLGLFTCVTGVSGSGKSSLINDTLYPLVKSHVLRSKLAKKISGKLEIIGEVINLVNITQSPIGRTPRSNPATYTGLFTHIRDIFAGTEESRARGYKTGRFSFNVKGGRCEACQGDGLIKVEMHFLADIYVSCDICNGKRYNRETLEINYKGKNINEVLSMTIEDALSFFASIPTIANKLQTLVDVGLSYITLGQSATTLSGGEAQRIKLSKELSKRTNGNALYILDEPTTGLHFEDINKLMSVLMRLRNKGNTILVIEHNLDVIKCADWVIDIGPEGGTGGGTVVAMGTPKDISKSDTSHTGKYLKRYFV